MRIDEFALERFYERYEFTAPYMLSSSDPETLGLAELLALADDELAARWGALRLGYTEVPGDPLLRAAIAALHPGVEADDVIVWTGAEEPIFALVNVLLGPGDHLVAVVPTYQSHVSVARACGAEVDEVALEEGADGWSLDLDRVRAAIRPTTRAIAVAIPNNPTGWLPDRATLDALVAIAEEADAVLLADEVYRRLEHDPADALPAAAELSSRAVSVGAMAKAWGLAGLRIGWTVCRDRELNRRLCGFKVYTTICNASPSELLATIAVRAHGTVIGRVLGLARANVALVDAAIAARPDRLAWTRPRAGTIGFPRLVRGEDADALALRLVEAEGVLLAPGSLFQSDRSRFRIGFGRADLPGVLPRLERFLDAG